MEIDSDSSSVPTARLVDPSSSSSSSSHSLPSLLLPIQPHTPPPQAAHNTYKHKRPPKQDSDNPKPSASFNPPDSELTVPRGHTSGVWAVFGLHPKHPGWSICRGCRKWLSYHKTTTNLKAHAQVCAHACALTGGEIKSTDPKRANSSASFSALKRYKVSNERQAQDISRALVMLVAENNLPLSLADSEQFQKFCGLLNKQYEVPGRAKLAQIVQKEYELVRAGVRVLLDRSESICLTADDVVTMAQYALQATTAHFINEHWDPVAVLLTTSAMPPRRRTIVDLQGLLDKTFSHWDISSKVFSSTADGAALISKYCNKMEAEEVIEDSVRCYWYTLQLAVKTALEENVGISTPIALANVILKYFRLNIVAMESLKKAQEDHKEIVEELILEREVVIHDPDYFFHPLKLVQDLCSRWLSTHAMCARLVKLKRHVNSVLQDLNPALGLSPLQWQQLAELVQVLQPCVDAIKYMESEQYPTISSVVPSIFLVSALLEGKSAQQPGMPDYSQFSAVVNDVRKTIIHEMKLPSSFEKFSRAARFACTLDPRFKHLNFLHAFQREATWQELRGYCETHFVDITGASSASSSSSSASSSAAAGGVHPQLVPLQVIVPPSASSSSSSSSSNSSDAAFTVASFDELMAHSMAAPLDLRPSIQAEIHAYRAAVAINKTENPLRWWRMHTHAYPTLSRMARRFLAVPTSFAPPERAFSKIPIMHEKHASSLLPEKTEELVFLKHNFNATTFPSF